jgi:hypothetical protein
MRRALPLLALTCTACAGRDITEVFGAITGIDPLRPDAGVSLGPVAEPPSAVPPNGVPPATDADAGALRGECGFVSRAAYEFATAAGESRVAYGEAVLDHALIAELGGFIEGLTARTQSGERFAEGELVARLAARLGDPAGTLADEPIALRLGAAPRLVEERHAELSPDVDVLSRLAGSDPSVEHRAWAEPGTFRGFGDTSLGLEPRPSFSPRSLLDACFEQLEENARNRALGFLQTDPARAVLPLHVMRDGRDLKLFLQSFLLGAVAFARGVDAELDDDVKGSGLSASEERLADARASALERAWDLGFGYFGAARDFDRYARADAAPARQNGWLDTNADCRVSLGAEVSWGAAALSLPTSALTYAVDAFDGFVSGRRLLAEAAGSLSSADRERLTAARDRAVGGWERSLAATLLHDLNRLDLELARALASSIDYSFAAQARAWSELKGLSLAFQFNRRSPLSPADFDAFQAAVGDAPSVPDTLPPRNGAALEAYRSRLTSARKLLVEAYGFDSADAATW